ncbi:ranBP-type and C3HC4-type zinc finger-containing protein 1-like [Hyperolius riggenbachi]|uniref:ranBP-type and C3HC4-type zinc finger-containing protein 1-like n=1 Tax=Hyperolius riggenbachi TaxID=752182 RepID=UPI0035A34D01
MAAGGLSQGLRTVLLSVSAWREGPGSSRESVQLSVTSESAGDFRLLLRCPARGSPQQVVGDFRLSDVSYDQIDLRSHRLTVPDEQGTSVIFSFDDEREAQKWWTVVSSSLREARKAAQSQQSLSAIKPLVCAKPGNGHNTPRPISLEAEPSSALDDQSTKEDLAARLSTCIESGDQTLASKYATELAKQRACVQVQLNPTSCPKNEINMKVGVEDAKGSVTISTYVFAHTTIAMLKQQIFGDYQFHPSIQRWIIGQCLCSDERTVGSYGIRKDGDTAFLYLLGAKRAKLTPQDQYGNGSYTLPPRLPPPGADDHRRANTLPNRPIARPVVNNSRPEMMDISAHLNPGQAAPPSPVQIGWACPTCTYINVPTRPGCEMCSMERPIDYIVPEGYKPDDSERRRLQQENDGLQQYKKAQEEERQQNFLYLLQLDNEVLVPNQEAIECRICYTEVPAGAGVLLRECLHSFCRDCLRQVVNCCEEPEVSCPFRDEMYACNSKLQEREIRALVSLEEYTRFLERGLVVAESRSHNSYHCRTADCRGWCIYEDTVNEFICPICGAENCLTCKAIHENMNCKEYQDDLRIRAQNDSAARQTSDMLKTLVQTGEAMYCPACEIIVQKKDGCDWLRCTMCQTEICWVTKGPRWGPQGPGDVSGGCKCNVNGRKCDPRCQNCH